MSAVGIVSIAVGALGICSRGPLVVAPAASLRWFEKLISTNGRVRVLGAVMLPLGVAMIWAGSTEDSGLAGLLFMVGLGIVTVCALWLLPFPDAYRALANEILPSDRSGSLIGWRIVGLAVVFAGALLIYFGALAL